VARHLRPRTTCVADLTSAQSSSRSHHLTRPSMSGWRRQRLLRRCDVSSTHDCLGDQGVVSASSG